MLVITPAETHGTTKFFEFIPPPRQMPRYISAITSFIQCHLNNDFYSRWKVDISRASSNTTSFEWLPTPTTSRPMTDVTDERTGLMSAESGEDKSKLCTPDGAFIFHLYTVTDALTDGSSA